MAIIVVPRGTFSIWRTNRPKFRRERRNLAQNLGVICHSRTSLPLEEIRLVLSALLASDGVINSFYIAM